METDSIETQDESLSESDSYHVCDDECATKIEYLSTNMEEQKSILENRLDSLKRYMVDLKEGLSREKELWKKEIDEVLKLTKTMENKHPCETESNMNIPSQMSDVQPTLNDMSILDYEQKLSMYQDALIRAHAEKKMHLRRHFAAHAYKTKLLEVENMCNLELLKVKQNVQFLQPLQAIASEWNFEHQHQNLDDEITGGPKVKQELNVKRDSATAIENFGNMINMELKELTNRLTPTPSATLNSNFGTSSSLVQEDEEDNLANQRLESTISTGCFWHNNDKNNSLYNSSM